MTETFFDQAIQRAEYLDSYLAENGKVVGPLHGLPISLKVVGNISKKVACNDTLLGLLQSQGCAFHAWFCVVCQERTCDREFCAREPAVASWCGLVCQNEYATDHDGKYDLGTTVHGQQLTTRKQTADTHNNVFGRTLNPYNRSLTAGGSSGGEGALIALRGSLIGVGTDIAGSVRVPALCCRIYGFKPTLDRVPYAGQVNPGRDGLAGIKCAAGPLTTNPDDLETFLEAVCNADAWKFDDTAISAPWRNVSAPGSLRIGLILEDKQHPLHPPILRIISEVVEKLKSVGHTLIELNDIPSMSEINIRSFQYFGMDPAGTPFKNIASSGEPRIPSIAISLLPESQWLPTTLESLYDLNEKRASDQAKFQRLIVENELDVILMPGNAGPASAHDTYGLPPYTVYINYLNVSRQHIIGCCDTDRWEHPACVLPYGVANENLDTRHVRDIEYVPSCKWMEAQSPKHG